MNVPQFLMPQNTMKDDNAEIVLLPKDTFLVEFKT